MIWITLMLITDLLENKEKKLLISNTLLRNETLFHEGDHCTQIGIVIDGSISIISYLPDGSEVIYNTLEKGEIFGNNLIFSSEPYYKGDIIARTDCSLYLIRKEDLLQILQKNSVFLNEYLRIHSDFSKKLNSRIRLLSISSARERFLYYLYDHKSQLTYTSISELARELYLERETLSRLLSRLNKEKIIIQQNKSIRLL